MGSVPSVHIFTAGEDATAANLNTFGTAINFLLAPPFAELSNSAVQSIGNNSTTGLTYDTEGIDSDNGHSTVSNTSRYTGQTPGWFWNSFTSGFASNATGVREWSIRVNGATQKYFVRRGTVAAAVEAMGVSGAVFLNGTTDYAESCVLQTSGAGLNTDISGGNPRWAILWCHS